MGAFGLCLFFMLSAYLIVSLLIRERAASGTVSIRSFALRRILRIWPLYFLGIALGCLSGIFWPDMRLPWGAVASMMLLATNLYVLRHGWVFGVIGPLWSIAVEEQFYLVIPWAAKINSRRLLASVLILALIVAEVVLFWLGTRHANDINAVWPNSFVQFQFFAVGGLLALWNDRHSNRMNLFGRALLIIGGLICWLLAVNRFGLRWSLSSNPSHLLAGYALVLLGTLAMFLAVLEIRIRMPKSLLYLGRISFGLYVYHGFLLRLSLQEWYAKVPDGYIRNHPVLVTPVAFASTVGVAHLSYRFFERPILRVKQRFETVKTRL
jgi:peptidoglycan/LPS O-acetylase OafA/YrhL